MDRSERIRREGARLIMLIAITAVAFFVTRAAAEHSHDAAVQDAAAWHERGRLALQRHDLTGAIDAFRRASLKDRGNAAYALSLAQALAADQQTTAAERILLALRDAAPERPDINLQLARLAARSNDAPKAVRYYRNALYAPWTDPSGPREIRLEFVRFLLDHDDRQRAMAELVAARANLPDTAAAHAELGGLFARAGDQTRALDEYRAALQRDPRSTDALIGAGQAAFATGDYRAAIRFLGAAQPLPLAAADLHDVAALVVSRDPLESRLGAAERRRRLNADLADIRQRIDACAALAPVEPWPPLPAHLDQDAIEDALSTVWRAERSLDGHCGPLTSLDRALQIIAQRHGADQ